MKQNITKTLLQLDKKKLVRLLEKEGIEASTSQPKSELVKLLLLARKANAPTKKSIKQYNKHDKVRQQRQEGWVGCSSSGWVQGARHVRRSGNSL